VWLCSVAVDNNKKEKPMESITEKERKVLQGIITNDFQDAATGTEAVIMNDIWVDCLEDSTGDLRGKILSGVVSSLSKKGLVWTDGEGIAITKEGWTVLNSTNSEEE
jgi:hypothetical protein